MLIKLFAFLLVNQKVHEESLPFVQILIWLLALHRKIIWTQLLVLHGKFIWMIGTVFFAHDFAELSVCYSVEAVQAIASKFKPLLQKFPIPQVTTKTVVKVNGCIDKIA